MGFLSALFGDKSRTLLLELIDHNAEIIERQESRTRIDAEYLAICMILDDLVTRDNGRAVHKRIMDILAREHSRHQSDVMTYLAVKHMNVQLTPDAQRAMEDRHKKVHHKNPYVEALSLPPKEFCQFVVRTVGVGQRETWATYAIALPNVRVWMNVSASLARETAGKGLPVDIDGFIRMVSATLEERAAEIEKERLTSQLVACLALRATNLAKQDDALADDLAQIWLMLVRGGAGLPRALKSIQSWSAQELDFFRHLATEKDGMQHILDVEMPKFMRRHPAIEQFAEDNNLDGY